MAKIVVTCETLKDVQQILYDNIEKTLDSARYSHLSSSRKEIVKNALVEKANYLHQDIVKNCRQPSEEEVPLEPVDQKLQQHVETLKQQLDDVERQLVEERKTKLETFETKIFDSLWNLYSTENYEEESNDAYDSIESLSEETVKCIQDIAQLYQLVKDEWQKVSDIAILNSKVEKFHAALKNISSMDVQVLKSLLENVSELLPEEAFIESSSLSSSESSEKPTSVLLNLLRNYARNGSQ